MFTADFARCETVEELDKLEWRWETEIHQTYDGQPGRLGDELLELRRQDWRENGNSGKLLSVS